MSIAYMMFLLCKIDINLNQNNQVDEILLHNAIVASCSWFIDLKFSTDFTNSRVKFLVKFWLKDFLI